MKLIIDIPDGCYEELCNGQFPVQEAYRLVAWIKDGMPQPKIGRWIKYGPPRCGEQHYKCTVCDDYINFGVYSDYYLKAFKYCPNCGAKMEVENESNN